MKPADRDKIRRKLRESLNFMQEAHGRLQDDDRFDLVSARALIGMARATLENIKKALD